MTTESKPFPEWFLLVAWGSKLSAKRKSRAWYIQGWHGNGTPRCKSLATLQVLYPLVSGDSSSTCDLEGQVKSWEFVAWKSRGQHVEEISGMIYCSNMLQLFSTEAWYDIQLTLRFQHPTLVRNFFGWSLGKVWFHCSFKKASTTCGIWGLTSPYVDMLSIASAASERTEPIAARVVVGRHETLRSRGDPRLSGWSHRAASGGDGEAAIATFVVSKEILNQICN